MDEKLLDLTVAVSIIPLGEFQPCGGDAVSIMCVGASCACSCDSGIRQDPGTSEGGSWY